MTYLGVCGWPVRHSRSPAMHNAALRACGLEGWEYLALPLPPELFTETVRALPAAGFRGVNVTIPHKEAALALADDASAAARAIGAANTLTFERDGAIARRQHRRARRCSRRCGRGSTPPVAARSCSARAAPPAPPCGRSWARGADVEVWNRTPARAAALASELGARHVAVPSAAEIVVNATSVGLEHEH